MDFKTTTMDFRAIEMDFKSRALDFTAIEMDFNNKEMQTKAASSGRESECWLLSCQRAACSADTMSMSYNNSGEDQP